jgi:hypothetical protein
MKPYRLKESRETDFMGDIAYSLMTFTISIFGITIDFTDIAGSLQNVLFFRQTSVNGTTYKGVQTLIGGGLSFGTLISNFQSAFVAVALQLLALFTIMNFIKLAMDVDRVSWEKCVMVFVRFMIFKMLIQNFYRLFTTIFSIGDDLLTKVTNIENFHEDVGNITTSVADVVRDAIDNPTIDFGWAQIASGTSLVLFILFLFILFPYIGTMVQIAANVLFRAIKIVLFMSIAPISIALTSYEDNASGAKRFIMQGVGIVFEAVFISLILFIYRIGISSIPVSGISGIMESVGFMISVLVMNALASMAISQSAQLADRWAGA